MPKQLNLNGEPQTEIGLNVLIILDRNIIKEERIGGSGNNPRIHEMLFWDRSQYSEGSVS